MTTTAATEPTLHHANSHSVSENPSGARDGIGKEEVYLYYRTTWRGTPCAVTMSADRYRHSSGLSEWRVYAQSAREVGADGSDWGPILSDTARHRLSEQCRPLVEAWLRSPAYAASEALAYARMIAASFRHLSTVDPHGDGAAHDIRRMVRQYSATLPTATGQAIRGVADRYDAYAAAAVELDKGITALAAQAAQ